jgi:hypothetical protein
MLLYSDMVDMIIGRRVIYNNFVIAQPVFWYNVMQSTNGKITCNFGGQNFGAKSFIIS